MTFTQRYFGVFLAMVALDVAFALYVLETAARNAVAGSFWAAMIQVANVFVVSSFVADKRLAVPCVVGAFVGTWLAITYL